MLGSLLVVWILRTVTLTEEQLLHEIEDLIRNRPSFSTITESENDDVLSWLGRVTAVLDIWDNGVITSVQRDIDIRQLHSVSSISPEEKSTLSLVSDFHQAQSRTAYRSLVSLLYRVRFGLLIKLGGPDSVSVPGGRPYDYFEEVRKIIELADAEVFFVDRYLDAEFASVYIPPIRSGILIRLLTLARMEGRLVPSLRMLKEQYTIDIEIRFANEDQIHDRYLFIDKNECYQSGSSFKDGSKKIQTTLTKITSAFDETLRLHEQIWSTAKEVKFDSDSL